MKEKRLLAVILSVSILITLICGIVPNAASDWGSWVGYGFSGNAIANEDTENPGTWRIGGYVGFVNQNSSNCSVYVYTAKIAVDVEGVALRARFEWSNTDGGFRNAVGFIQGMGVYITSDGIELAIAQADETATYSFDAPEGFKCEDVNELTLKDNGQGMFVLLNGNTMAMLKLNGKRIEDNVEYYDEVIVLDAKGTVKDTLKDTYLVTKGNYVGYTTDDAEAFIEVSDHSFSVETFDDVIPGYTFDPVSVTPTPVPTQAPTLDPSATPKPENGWEQNWFAYGFDSNANVADVDGERLIQGYVGFMYLKSNSAQNYTFDTTMSVEYEGVAIRCRADWSNTAEGFRSATDLMTGIGVIPCEKNILLCVATDSDGIKEYTLEAPEGYTLDKPVKVSVRDNAQAMFIYVNDVRVAVIKLEGEAVIADYDCYAKVTVMKSGGEIFDVLNDAMIVRSNNHIGYSSMDSDACIFIDNYLFSRSEFTDTVPDGIVMPTQEPTVAPTKATATKTPGEDVKTNAPKSTNGAPDTDSKSDSTVVIIIIASAIVVIAVVVIIIIKKKKKE